MTYNVVREEIISRYENLKDAELDAALENEVHGEMSSVKFIIEDSGSPFRCAKCDREMYEKYTSIKWQFGYARFLCRTCSRKLNVWLAEGKEVWNDV